MRGIYLAPLKLATESLQYFVSPHVSLTNRQSKVGNTRHVPTKKKQVHVAGFRAVQGQDCAKTNCRMPGHNLGGL